MRVRVRRRIKLNDPLSLAHRRVNTSPSEYSDQRRNRRIPDETSGPSPRAFSRTGPPPPSASSTAPTPRAPAIVHRANIKVEVLKPSVDICAQLRHARARPAQHTPLFGTRIPVSPASNRRLVIFCAPPARPTAPIRSDAPRPDMHCTFFTAALRRSRSGPTAPSSRLHQRRVTWLLLRQHQRPPPPPTRFHALA